MAKHGIYFHGFASGPASAKGELLSGYVAEQLDSFHCPDLNGDDFEHLRMEDWFARACAAVDAVPVHESLLLCGSSLGAYTAAVLASLCPHKNVALLLMAPAFGFTKRWPHILGSTQALAAWQTHGSIDVFHYAYDEERPLSYEFYQSCQELIDYPTDLKCPLSLIHGKHDAVVDRTMVDAFVTAHPQGNCSFMDDDHALLAEASQACIRSEALRLIDALG